MSERILRRVEIPVLGEHSHHDGDEGGPAPTEQYSRARREKAMEREQSR